MSPAKITTARRLDLAPELRALADDRQEGQRVAPAIRSLAVAAIQAGAITAAEVARDLRVSEGNVSDWQHGRSTSAGRGDPVAPSVLPVAVLPDGGPPIDRDRTADRLRRQAAAPAQDGAEADPATTPPPDPAHATSATPAPAAPASDPEAQGQAPAEGDPTAEAHPEVRDDPGPGEGGALAIPPALAMLPAFCRAAVAALAEAATLPEVQRIRGSAEAWAAYARRMGAARAARNECDRVMLIAEATIGAKIAEAQERGDLARADGSTHHRPKEGVPAGNAFPPTLAQAGFTRKAAMNARRLAAAGLPAIHAEVDHATEKGRAPSRARILQSGEAPPARPAPAPRQASTPPAGILAALRDLMRPAIRAEAIREARSLSPGEQRELGEALRAIARALATP